MGKGGKSHRSNENCKQVTVSATSLHKLAVQDSRHSTYKYNVTSLATRPYPEQKPRTSLRRQSFWLYRQKRQIIHEIITIINRNRSDLCHRDHHTEVSQTNMILSWLWKTPINRGILNQNLSAQLLQGLTTIFSLNQCFNTSALMHLNH